MLAFALQNFEHEKNYPGTIKGLYLYSWVEFEFIIIFNLIFNIL